MSGQPQKKKTHKPKARFFPNSPTSVGSPKNDGFYPRQVLQRTPAKLCSLVLPPPLISLFDNTAAGDSTAATAATTRLAGAASSDNVSLDGHSIIDNTTPMRHSSNASVVSASVGMGSGGSVSAHHSSSARLPLHLRVGMAPCDPLLVFNGRFVLVATCDGRIAIYSLLDFGHSGNNGIPEDVEASERRRRAEWREEDSMMAAQQRFMMGEDEKKVEPTPKTNTENEPFSDANETRLDAEEEEEEEHEADMRDRMHQREKAKQNVEPILIVTLPKMNNGSGEDQHQSKHGSHDEESIVSTGNIATPPTIVSMCATPGAGTSLIEQRETVSFPSGGTIAEGQTDGPMIPSLDPLGHVAVLTGDGEVHVLEFLNTLSLDDLQQTEAGSNNINDTNNQLPIVNCVLSFNTGHLGATCICVHPVLDNSINNQHEEESVHIKEHIRLCIGHQSGILAAFQVYSSCLRSPVQKIHSSPKEKSKITAPGDPLQESDTKMEHPKHIPSRHCSDEIQTPGKSAALHARSKSTDFFREIGSTIMQSTTGITPLPALFQNIDASIDLDTDNLHPKAFQRTLSEPIPVSDVDKSELAPAIGPARVELCWKGKFDVPIRSVSSPGWEREGEREYHSENSLIVVGIEQRQHQNVSQGPMNGMPPLVPHHSLSPAISLEVINATLAEHLWNNVKNGHPVKTLDSDKCIQLYDCSVWSSPGKEIKDGWMRGSQRRGIDARDELFGRLGLQRTSVTNKLCCFEGPDPCFASASSDGTVAISHCHSADGSWGVTSEENQIMLSQRCIGMGTLDYRGNLPYNKAIDGALGQPERYIVCSLRGGTVYLIPVAEPSAAASNRAMRQNHITMFTVPMDPDGDDDGLVRFVQAFAAGIVQVRQWTGGMMGKRGSDTSDDASATKAVAMVGWPGGIIDAYEIPPAKIIRNREVLLSEIVDRGAVKKLVERLLEINKSHPLISSDLWSSAWDECHRVNNLDTILKGIKDSASSRDFISMRNLLLSL